MVKMISRDDKKAFLSHLRTIVTKKKCTIMVGSRMNPGADDHFLVCLSPNIMKRIPKLPQEHDGLAVQYQELEPFPKFTHKIDTIF